MAVITDLLLPTNRPFLFPMWAFRATSHKTMPVHRSMCVLATEELPLRQDWESQWKAGPKKPGINFVYILKL